MKERFETFTVLINRINRNIRKIKNGEMSEYKLRSSHISCLYFIYLSDRLTATELCEHCEEDKATISRSLDYLEKNGYLICECQSAKRYKSAFTLTEKGMEVAKKIADKIDRVISEVSLELTDEERALFYGCLTMISERLELISKKINKKDGELK